MADSDNSSYLLRYNLVSMSPEYFGGSDWYPMTLNNLSATFPAAAGAHSFQLVAADLTLEAGSGSSSGSNPKFLAGGMLSIHGTNLTATSNYLGGVIGQYDIPGTKNTTYPAGAVLGMIADGTTTADGAFVAFLDGDSSVTQARAAYTVMCNNSNASSKFTVGLDLKGASHDGFQAVTYSTGEIRFSNGTYITVSGNTIVFHNAANDKTSTITMS
jgi:hypothetical protein